MNLQEWFEKGIDPDEYIESMKTNKENLLHVFDHFEIPDDDDFFKQVQKKNLRVIVLTEDWCGDAMMNIPILLHIAQKANIEASFLARDNNLELMDQYLTNGKSRSIPIFIFIDEEGKERATWGPRAPKIQTFVEEATANLPAKNAADFKDKQKQVFTFVSKSYRENTDFWNQVYLSIKQTLTNI
ncbi:thioredoxin family protein [Aquibacillus sediminis]|uniref:thioredoxin family protein n=1 Tax=Aquibacillus sediminis TaxID=2574734 RepID=UPI001109F5F2|nr:thioredoxin family protein [Aquibacillus sediminis]